MPSIRCNIRVLEATTGTYQGVARSLPPATKRSVAQKLQAARAAAQRGRCAEMHKHAQAARAVLERRLDALLGARPRKRRRR